MASLSMRCPQEVGLHGPWRIGKAWTIEMLRAKVKHALSRVRNILLPATLTLEEWIVTVDHFAGRCAYCKRRRFEMIEHVVSVSAGGGTTPGNCLPACASCNAKKSHRPFEKVFPKMAEELRAYLSARSIGKDLGAPPQNVIKFRSDMAKEVRWMSSIDAVYFRHQPVAKIVKWLDNYLMWTDEERERAWQALES